MTLENIKAHLLAQFHLPEEQIEIMLPSFVSALESHMNDLDLALNENSIDKIAKVGHTIKGACLNLGLEAEAEVAFEIEQRGKAKESGSDFKELVDKLHLLMDPLLENSRM